MKVTDVRTILITAPWSGDPYWIQDAPFVRTTALVQVMTDEGIVGLGETVMGYFCPDVVTPLVAYYAALITQLGLDPLQPERVYAELYQRSLWWGRVGLAVSVLSGIEMALWDVAGKAAGKPVWALLGGAAHARLPLYASGGTGTWPVEKTVEQAQRYVGLGFRGLKLGTGYTERPGGIATGAVKPPYGTWYAGTTSARVEDERTKFAALRAALGPDVELAIDSHAVQVREPWSRRNALDLARAVEEFDLLFYEEPLRYDDPAGYAELRRHTRIPIAGGECLTGEAEFAQWLEVGALDYVQPDASHVGGVGPCARVARMAEDHHVGLIVHTGGAVGPGLMANLHVAFASPNARYVEYALAPDNIRAELLVAPVALVDGMVDAPTEPGLGVRLEDATIAAYPFRPGNVEYA